MGYEQGLVTLLSLFDNSGVWSRPYEKAGNFVIRIDILDGYDILDIDNNFLDRLGTVKGILAAPPCTDFSVSGARWFKDKDADGRTAHSIRLVKKTLEIIDYLKPEFWCLENPIGRIHTLVPELGKPKAYFQPFEYAGYADDPGAERYTKRTALWGEGFVMPLKYPLSPILGSKMHLLPPSPDRARLRSVTPTGFSRAFWGANPL